MANAHAQTRRRSSGAAAERKPAPAGAKRRGFDPVTAEIIRGAMETICYEVAAHVGGRTAMPIVDVSNQRSATIVDARGRLVALSGGIPQLMLSSGLPVRFAFDFFGAGGLRDGDVLVGNDPYHGGRGLSDYNVFAPVMVAGKPLLVVSIQCHRGDGVYVPPECYMADSPDIWAEGVRFPAIKVVEQGVERADVIYMMKTNNRNPRFLSDFRAQIGAAQRGTDRLKEVLAKYGATIVLQAVEHSIDVARRRVRDEVTKWPDGVYYGDAYVDNDPLGNTDIRVHVKVTVKADQLTIDFTGSDMRQNLAANSTFGNTLGYVVTQLACMTDPTIPKNEGFFESVEFVVPKGCCLNPHDDRPVAVGTYHPGIEAAEAVAVALAPVIPERSCPQISKVGMSTTIFGVHPATDEPFTDPSVDTFAAHCGAVKGRDGWGMNVSFGNATAEINESIFPYRQVGRDYDPDTGGPGKWRGCPGSRHVKTLTAPATVCAYVVGRKHPMPGVAGGKNGMPNEMRCRVGSKQELVIEGASRRVPHQAGEAYACRNGGGGGWGNPLDRDPERVKEDVLDGYVSLRGARYDYGVVLTGSVEEFDLAVDRRATNELRGEMRADREGRR